MPSQELQASLLQHSQSPRRIEAKNEWELYDSYYNNETDDDGNIIAEYCICGTEIRDIFVLKNKYTDTTINVGSTCINNFTKNLINKLIEDIKKLHRDPHKSVSADTIIISHEKTWITDNDKNFYLDVFRKRTLSEKQQSWKNDINQKIRAGFQHHFSI